MRFAVVFIETVQQIHSLRASGVMSSHFSKAFVSAANALRRSAGISCAIPLEIVLVIRLVYKIALYKGVYSVYMKGERPRPKASKHVLRTDPELWEKCKHEAVEKLGKFSARAMQHAVVLYKERGGGYIGEKSPENTLVKWNKTQKKTQD